MSAMRESMQVIESSKIWYFDVDDTLVFSHELSGGPQDIMLGNRWFSVHWKHRELILDLLARGHTVVIWSAGGWEWAEMVATTLFSEKERETNRLVVVSKPDGFCDDKMATEWMGENDRFYISFLGKSK